MKIHADGSVEGTFKYVEGYTGFNSEVPGEQEGYFFPFSLKQTGTTMTFKKNGVDGKKDIPFEKDNVFRVTKTDTFTVLVDNIEVVTFSFNKATFIEKAESLDNLTKAELLNIAKAKGIEGVNSKTTNATLIDLIKQS